jgi:hypothetical protein
MNGTFLHTRRFLAYHGDRFVDRSALVYDSGVLAGVFPAAEALGDPATVVSHPGATYGGLVHGGRLLGARSLEALSTLREHYAQRGFTRLLYKPVPHIHVTQPAQDDLYSLFRLGAVRTRCDLNCAIDLGNRRAPSERRRRSLKRASTMVTLDDHWLSVEELWVVLVANLAREHGVSPVHTLAQLQALRASFPDWIHLCVARVEQRVEAGVILFNSRPAWHAQYIAASDIGYKVSALDAVFSAVIQAATAKGARWFDFGISTEQSGLVLNAGLYKFKSEFGGSGVVHEWYALELG